MRDVLITTLLFLPKADGYYTIRQYEIVIRIPEKYRQLDTSHFLEIDLLDKEREHFPFLLPRCPCATSRMAYGEDNFKEHFRFEFSTWYSKHIFTDKFTEPASGLPRTTIGRVNDVYALTSPEV